MDELSHGCLRFRSVVIDHQPTVAVEASLEGKVAHPSGALGELAGFPTLVVVGLQGHLGCKHRPCQALQQQAGDQPVEITLMRQNHLWLH